MNRDVPPTEAENVRTAGLDSLRTRELVELLIAEQRAAVDAVLACGDAIARAVEEIVERIEAGGTLHYVGAGTSGRLAALDAAEMPPTFGTPPELVRAHLAGGAAALARSIEGAEDDARAGAAAMESSVKPGDVVIGISASGGAAFVIAAIERAKALGARTFALTSVEGSRLARTVHAAIVLETGAEAVSGSTRLTAGTAQKIALNALSTALMVRLGKVYGNLMVDVVASNAKLRERALRLVMRLAGVGEPRASELLERADGGVKVAIVMARHGLDAPAARELLTRHRGSLRTLL
ncbi:MAG TPA: N-acetylmuramic acid 6-phosphate etherase [Candidatus Nitrosotalea sp.]|nr:N-acetylmuramic acid 6-phosphate etherase [Candidatus Nitrosotalea sp.]